MQELSVKVSGNVQGNLEKAPEAFKKKRKALLAQAAPKIREALNRNIASSIDDSHGTIRGWQRRHDGSGGGYVAYRAISASDISGGRSVRKRAQEALTGANSPGAITNYLESGHDVRFPSGKWARYKPEVHCARARAFGFYQSTEPDLKKLEAEMSGEMEHSMASALEGQT